MRGAREALSEYILQLHTEDSGWDEQAVTEDNRQRIGVFLKGVRNEAESASFL